MKESEKERIKLTASFINGLAVATATLGFAPPIVAALYNVVNAPPLWQAMLYGAGWLAAAFVLHLFAGWYLGDLDE
jgi:hypothetical protein